MFARKADDDLAGLAGILEELVAKNSDKKAAATIVLLSKKDEVAERLRAIAKEKKLEHVPLTVAKDLPDGPAEYKLPKAGVTVVVYDKEMNVRRTLVFEKLDAKAREAIVAEFEKVLKK